MPEFNSTVEYRTIEGFSGYSVGSDGSVWSCWARVGHSWRPGSRWKRLKDMPGRVCGHRRVELSPGHKLFYVHRLVLEAFVGACPEGMEACHYPDRHGDNNNLENLRWDTHKANAADSSIHGTRVRGERCGSAKLDDETVRHIRSRVAAGLRHGDIARMARELKMPFSTIRMVARGESWKHVE